MRNDILDLIDKRIARINSMIDTSQEQKVKDRYQCALIEMMCHKNEVFNLK